MFRYIGLSWTQEGSAQADQLDRALRSRGGWELVLRASGHHVYVAGAMPGINDAYALPSGDGVILGRLFRRGTQGSAAHARVSLTAEEAFQIAQSKGRALIDRFWGRYVAFLPTGPGEGHVLRDPTGALPCFRLNLRGVTVILSRLEDLLALPHTPVPAVDWEAVAAHLLFGRLDGPDTALQGVPQVIPGELTPLHGDRAAPRALWRAVDVANRPAPDSPHAARDLRDTIDECVRSWASCYAPLVLRLSGGLDSAILLGSLGIGEEKHRVTCLNYHAVGTDSDERPYARLAAQRAGVPLIERSLEADFRLEDVLKVDRTPLPVNHLGSMGTARTDAEVARSLGANAIFSGAGGDQLLFELRCTWPAADHLKLRGFGLDFLEAALDAAHLGRVSFWRALRLAFKDRTFRGHPADGADRFSTLMRREASEAAASTATRFAHPSWPDTAELPIGKFHQVGMLTSPFEYYNHYLGEALPERVHPLMSQPILELCLATPTYVLTRGGRGRALARRAFADRLPHEIATRRSKGGMDVYATAMLQRNRAFARELLLDGRLARHGILDRQRVEAALGDRPSSAATYISEIHACIAVEAWLQRMASSTAQPAA